MKYTQSDPLFLEHVKKLITMTIKIRGYNYYFFKTEEHEDPDSVLDSEWITCGHCCKRVSVKDETKVKSTGLINYIDNVRYTKCCGPSIEKELCPMVCVCCKRPALYLTPHTNPTGFTFIPGKSYHIDACSECDGRGGMKSLILEQVVHNNLNQTKSLDTRVT